MKRIMSIVLAALLVISMVPFAVLAEEGDIEIATYADLVAWAENGSDDAGKTVRLTADIVANAGTAASFKTTAPANVWTPKDFAGTFDGQGHSISGLYNAGNGGLIRNLYGTLKNLYLLESCITGNASSVGIVVNGGTNATVQNVYANGYMSCANHSAGILGIQSGAVTLISCWFDGEIEATGRYVAGMVGNQQSKALTVIDCLNTGKISTTNTTGDIAGISGGTYSGSLNATRCVNLGLIVANDAGRATGGMGVYFDAPGSASFVDCYSMVGTANAADSVYFRNVNQQTTSAKTVGKLSEIPDLTGWTHNIDGFPVPQYFAEVEAKNNVIRKNAVEISTYAELVDWASKARTDYKGMTAILTADIVANTGDPESWLTTPPANVWTPVRLDSADFDGQGHTISGLYVKTTADGQGFFSTIGNAEARNFRLVNSLLDASNAHAGLVAGYLADFSRISDIYVDGLAVAASGVTSLGGVVGGLAGSTLCTVRNVWFNGEVRGAASYASGIVGNQESRNLATIDVLNTGKVSTTGNGNIYAGISGAVYTGSIDALRTVNAGVITCASGNDASAIVNTITSNTSKAGWATFADTYTVKHTATHAMPMDVRFTRATNSNGVQTDNYYPAVTGAVGEIDSLNDLLSKSAFSGWVQLTNGLVVPGCFADITVGSYAQETRDVIEIGTYDQLVAWAASSNKAGNIVLLTADITANTGDAAEWATSAPAKVWTPVSGFTGVFDGQGHTISGIYSAGSGLFARADYTELLNFRLVNSCFNVASGRSSAIVDNAAYTTIKNVYTDAIVISTAAAGSFCANQAGPIIMENFWSNGIVKSTGTYVSGIIANQQSNYLKMTDVLNTAAVYAVSNVAGVSNAVYQGTFYGTRVVNAGKVYAMNNNGSAIVDIVSANNAAGGVAVFTDNYAVAGTADFMGIREKRTSNVTGSSVTGTINLIGSLADLSSNSAFSGWDTVNGVKVPAGFGQYAVSDNNYVPATIEIGDYEQLKAWASSTANVYDNVILTADITVDTATYGAWSTKNFFKGVFDGQGYSITGLPERLVNSISNASFIDVSLIDSATVGSTRGAFAANAYGYNVFYNCYVSGSFTGGSDSVGGFIGQLLSHAGTASNAPNTQAYFDGCWFDGDITISNRYASGFVGNNQSQNATFADCLFTGSVTATAPGDTPIVAGFAGAAYNGVNSYINCLYAGTMSFGGTWENNAGGALGLRAYKASQETYANNYALDNGTYKFLMNESEGENPDTEGKIAKVSDAELATLAASLGDNWGYATVDGVKMAVPAAFAENATVVYGDADGDGEINTIDLTIVAQYLADSSTVLIPENADANGDGSINTIDLTLVAQYLADSSTVLGPQG